MPFFVILKRFEVWLLGIVVAALLIFALRPEPGVIEKAPEKPLAGVEPAIPEPNVEEDKKIIVENVKVSGTQGGQIIELTLLGRSRSGEDLILNHSTVTAATGEGEPVPLFFEPFQEPSMLLASESSMATLRWWLARPTGAIWLTVQGQQVKAELP